MVINIIITIIKKVRAFINNLIVAVKKIKWKRYNINLDKSVMIFKETVINAMLGSVEVSKRSCIRGTLEIQRRGGQIFIGEDCYVGDRSNIWAASKISIGNHVLIAHDCNIFDNDTHPLDYLERRSDAENIILNGCRDNYSTLRSAPINICDDVWIGCGCIVLKGVTIGSQSVVAAGSVVTKDVPERTLVAGNPAKVIRQF